MVSYTHLFLAMLFCWPIRRCQSSFLISVMLSVVRISHITTISPQGLTVGNPVPVPRCHFQLPTQT